LTLSQKTKGTYDSSTERWTGSGFNNPNTTDDMIALDTWQFGTKLYGSFAQSLEGYKRYRDDINKAYGNEKDYDSNVIYVDTFKPIGPQLKKFS